MKKLLAAALACAGAFVIISRIKRGVTAHVGAHVGQLPFLFLSANLYML